MSPARDNGHTHSERGTILMESLVALYILSIIGVAFLSALSSGFIASDIISQRTVSGGLAQAQMEYVKNCTYLSPPAAYPAIAAPQGYSIVAEAASIPGTDSNIEKIMVSIYRGDDVLLVLEDFKVNR